MSVQLSEATDLTEHDSHLTLALTSSQQGWSLRNGGNVIDRNLNTDMRISSEQMISLQNLPNQVKSTVDGNKINRATLIFVSFFGFV